MFLLNPANAGNDKSCYSFSAFYQNQWLGMDESPTTQIFNFQGPLGHNLGFGSYIYNDRNGNMKELGIHQALSYEVLLKKSRRKVSTLAFGLAFSLEQSKIDESGLNNPSGVLDPVMTGGIISGVGFNASAGVLLKHNDYQFGFSVTNMFNQTNPLYKSPEEPELPTDFHAFISSLYKITDRDIYLEPIIMYRQNTELIKRLDLTVKGTFPTPDPDYALWGLVSYRRTMDDKFGKSLGWGTTVGVNYRRVSLGFEWQLGLTGAQIDYGSAYQLVLKYSICNNLKHHAIPCSIIRRNKKARYSGLSW